MKKYLPAILYILGNSIVIYILNVLFPTSIVLGNRWIGGILAVLWLGVLITAFDFAAKKFNENRLKITGRFPRMGYYFAFTTVLVWVLARIPDFSAFGIVRFYWAIVIGAVLTLGQWGTRQLLKAIKKI